MMSKKPITQMACPTAKTAAMPPMMAPAVAAGCRQ
jgi:hypothetical protein